jgi:hypothetical protein
VWKKWMQKANRIFGNCRKDKTPGLQELSSGSVAKPGSLLCVQLRQGASDEFFVRPSFKGFVEREKRLRRIDKIANQFAWPAASLAYSIKVPCKST